MKIVTVALASLISFSCISVSEKPGINPVDASSADMPYADTSPMPEAISVLEVILTDESNVPEVLVDLQGGPDLKVDTETNELDVLFEVDAAQADTTDVFGCSVDSECSVNQSCDPQQHTCAVPANGDLTCTITCKGGWFPRIWYGFGSFTGYWEAPNQDYTAQFVASRGALCSRPEHPILPTSAWFDLLCEEITSGDVNTFGSTDLVKACVYTETGNLVTWVEIPGVLVESVGPLNNQNQVLFEHYCPE